MMEQQLYENTYRSEQSHWWFVGRRTLVFDQLAQAYSGRTDLRILDVGCGTGLNMKYLAQYGAVTGVDLSSTALQFSRQRGEKRLIKAPIEHLPFADNTFDLVTAMDIIEHLDDDWAALREIARVLEPGGRVVILVPAYEFLWSLQDEISSHRRRYVIQQVRRVITASGLTMERATYANTLLFPIVYAGRMVLKVQRRVNPRIENENGLHPGWSNGLLTNIFKAEAPLLRRVNAPFGVSILAVATKPDHMTA